MDNMIIYLPAGFDLVRIHELFSMDAQVLVPPTSWSEPYRVTFVHCGPAAPLPQPVAGPRFTAGSRWFG